MADGDQWSSNQRQAGRSQTQIHMASYLHRSDASWELVNEVGDR